MPKPAAKQYRTKNWKAYNAGLKSRGSLSIWLDKDMAWFAGDTGKHGRSPTYSDAAIQFCLSLVCATKPAALSKTPPFKGANCGTREALPLRAGKNTAVA
jgi:hypothetical protein